MNLLWNHFLTECRAQRWMLLSLFAYALSIAFLAPLVHQNISGELREMTLALLLIILLVLALCPLVLSFSLTPFIGSSAFWLSRPLSRKTLFWSKNIWIILCILTPCGAGIYFWYDHLMLTGRQHAIVFTLIFTAFTSLIAFISVIRSTSRGYPSFFTYLCVGIGLQFVTIFILNILPRSGVSHLPLNRSETPLLGGMLYIILISIISWFLIALWKKHKSGLTTVLVGVAFFPVVSVFLQIPIITHPTNTTYRHKTTLIHPNNAFETRKPGEMVLWHNVLISGLEKDHIVLPTNGSITWEDTSAHGSKKNIHLIDVFRMRDSLRAIKESSIWDRISTNYPKSITWEILGGRQHPAHRNLQIPTEKAKENISLSLQGTVYRCIKLSSLDCEQGTKQKLKCGGVAHISKLSVNDGSLQIQLETTRPNAILRNEPVTNISIKRNRFEAEPLWAVLFHPTSQHAMLLPINNSHRKTADPTQLIQKRNNTLDFPIPALQIALLGRNIDQWLAECELHLHGLQAIGPYESGILTRDDYQLHPDSRHYQLSLIAGKSQKPLENITLPDNPTSEQLSSYLDDIVRLSSMNNTKAREKLMQLPIRGLIELAKRIPIYDSFDSSAFHVFNKRAAELPANVVLEGLKKDARFAHLCTVKKLEKKAAPILVARLRHRQPLPWSASGAIGIICRNAPLTPELTTDLHWHFLHSKSYQRSMITALESYEGFDFQTAIEAAWNLPRVQTNASQRHAKNQLAPYALPFGDKEALRLILLWFRGQQPEWLGKKHLSRLQRVIPANIPANEAVRWAEQHFIQLHFDHTARKYKLR